MPRTKDARRRNRAPKRVSDDALPSTVERSPDKAKRTFRKTLASAHQTYPEDEGRAHRTAFAALKHSFEKVDDHWEPKRSKGPSDRGAKRRRPSTRGETAGGVDVEGHTKDELVERARGLGIRGARRMRKLELGKAIAAKQGRRGKTK